MKVLKYQKQRISSLLLYGYTIFCLPDLWFIIDVGTLLRRGKQYANEYGWKPLA